MDQNNAEKTILSAQMPVALRDELMRLADINDRSMSAEVRAAVRAYVGRADASAEDSSTGRAMTSSSRRAPAGRAASAGAEFAGRNAP